MKLIEQYYYFHAKFLKEVRYMYNIIHHIDEIFAKQNFYQTQQCALYLYITEMFNGIIFFQLLMAGSLLTLLLSPDSGRQREEARREG